VDPAVAIHNEVLDAAVDRHLTADGLRFGLRVGGVGRPLAAFNAVLPDTILVIGLDVAFRHRSTPFPFSVLTVATRTDI
jgi:hypothetical protein